MINNIYNSNKKNLHNNNRKNQDSKSIPIIFKLHFFSSSLLNALYLLIKNNKIKK